MQVGVAILAFVGRIGEFEVGMAVAAGHSGMAPAQGEPRLCMIELDLVLNYLPIRGGVARNARRVDIAMRTLCRSERPRGLHPGRCQRPQEQHG